MKTIYKLLILIFVTTCFVDTMYSQSLVKESFDYPTGDLNFRGSNTDGWSGPWSKDAGSKAINVVGVNLAPDDEGKSVQTATGSVKYYRSFTLCKDTAGTVYWIGFMIEVKHESQTGSWGGLSLFKDQTPLLFMGSPWQANKLGIEIKPPTGSNINSTIQDDSLNWFVVKLVMNGTTAHDSVYLFINPNPDSIPSVKNAVGGAGKLWAGSNGFNRIEFGKDAPLNLLIDGLRIGTSYESIKIAPTTSIAAVNSSNSSLSAYPNPFFNTTNIEYSLTSTTNVTLKVYSTIGQEVASLVSGRQESGTYKVEWNANSLPAGIYYYQLKAGKLIDTKKIIKE